MSDTTNTVMPSDFSTTSQVEPVGLDLSDFNVSDDDILKASSENANFSAVGEVKIPDDVSYLEFQTVDLMKLLLPFKQKKAAARDIITKSLYITVNEMPGKAVLRSTDGISFLQASISVRCNKFPEFCIIDTESLYNVARSHSKLSYLIFKEGKYFSNFYGGEIFIPSYSIDRKMFTKNLGEPAKSGDLNASILLDSIKSFSSILSASDIPELGYIFSCDDAIYASNGVLVAKLVSSLPQCVIRQSDLGLITFLLESIKDSSATLTEYSNFYLITSDGLSYSFPKISNQISQGYKNSFLPVTGKYFVNLPYILSVSAILSTMPESSGVIGFKFEKDSIIGIAKTRKGDTSTFRVSNASEGTVEEGEITISLKALSTAFRVFKGVNSISFSYQDGKIFLSSESKHCVILLKK